MADPQAMEAGLLEWVRLHNQAAPVAVSWLTLMNA